MSSSFVPPTPVQLGQNTEDFKLPPEVLENMNNSLFIHVLPLSYTYFRETGKGRFEIKIDEFCILIGTREEMFEKTHEIVNIEI